MMKAYIIRQTSSKGVSHVAQTGTVSLGRNAFDGLVPGALLPASSFD